MTPIDRTRWLALIILCMGSLMIVLDSTIVNVALPSIKTSLGFSDTSLAWVVNAYMLTFGGFMLLGGRLGDLYGYRKMFLAGIIAFTIASLACGLANTQVMLIIARALQGLAGAVVSAVALSLIMNLFVEPAERAKAMGVFGFVSSGGGSIGVLLGGVLTSVLDWHWIFLVNVPIGIAVFALCLWLLPKNDSSEGHVDIGGAVTITLSLIMAVYAIINGNATGWGSAQTLGLLAVAVALLGLFVFIEHKVKHPLMPLGMFKRRNLVIANGAGVLWAGGMFAWFFLSALYMQYVLSYTPLQVGLSFLPSNVIMMIFSLGLSARIVMRFGIRKSLTAGLALVTLGLLLFVRAPVNGQFVTDILPSMLLLGFGAGIAFNPMLLAAMSDVDQHESGLASGIVNTSFMMGGSLGLAILASVAAWRTESILGSGMTNAIALTGGYNSAFLVGAVFTTIATILVGTLLRPKPMSIDRQVQGHH